MRVWLITALLSALFAVTLVRPVRAQTLELPRPRQSDVFRLSSGRRHLPGDGDDQGNHKTHTYSPFTEYSFFMSNPIVGTHYLGPRISRPSP